MAVCCTKQAIVDIRWSNGGAVVVAGVIESYCRAGNRKLLSRGVVILLDAINLVFIILI